MTTEEHKGVRCDGSGWCQASEHVEGCYAGERQRGSMTVPPRDPGHPLLTDAAIEAAAEALDNELEAPHRGRTDREVARDAVRAVLATLARDGNTITIWRCDKCGRLEFDGPPKGQWHEPPQGPGHVR